MNKLTNIEDEINEFSGRRFPLDVWHSWINGNCYYFALILKDRFPGGDIYYDTIYGHFVYKYGTKYYDWSGVYHPRKEDDLIPWKSFKEYDSTRYNRIVENCLR